jgi:hypothetical protein
MTQVSTTAAASLSAAPFPHPPLRCRPGEESYITGLKAKLAIAPDQAQAWGAFAAVLSANRHRVRSSNARSEGPFGPIAERLEALASMRGAGEQLLAVLDPVQRRGAVQALPLCCLQEVPEIRRLLA